jgi:hypothetical protein
MNLSAVDGEKAFFEQKLKGLRSGVKKLVN